MKTREEVEKLKREWGKDPCWDIYDTEGFEEYKDELIVYQKSINDKYEADMPEEKSLDNYFVSRSIDNLKDNGTMALIVAPGVLENNTNEEFRLSLNKKAQFIGAVKLPNRSFHHTHTQVMPDILLFRKYPKDIQDRLSAVDDETFKTLPLYDNDFVSGAYVKP